MFHTIVVPLDGSSLAERALPIGVELARRGDARLVLIRVHQPPAMAMSHAYEWNQEHRGREEAYLAGAAQRVRLRLGAVPETLLVDGRPAAAIADVAQHRDASLVVMCSHGRTGFSRSWLGSVTDAVIRCSSVPVLMVRGDDERPAERGEAPSDASETNARVGVQRVLVPLDGSLTAEEILPYARAIAVVMGAKIELLRVLSPDEAPPAPARLAEDAVGALVRDIERKLRVNAVDLARETPTVEVETCVRVSDSPANFIIGVARADDCDMVAMTTHAAGLARLVIGSVADKVIRSGPPLVLLVRPIRR